MAYDAIIEVSAADTTREVLMADFAPFYMTPAIEPDEIVTGLKFKPWPKGHGSAFVEFARRHGDFALASVAVLVEIAAERICRASITVGGLAHKPTRVREAEHVLLAEPANDSSFRKAAEACGAIDAIADIHGSKVYRQQVARTLAFRAIAAAHSRAVSFRTDRPV
jgi:carbon-monoxide dehydrogenase medium subunit